MAGLDVEFLDTEPAEEPGASAETTPAPQSARKPARSVAWAAIALWGAAAVLGLLSTFQTVFTYRFDFSVIHTRGGYNALGYSLDAALAGDRWPGYAFILGFCATVFALLAVVKARAIVTGAQSPMHRYAAGIGIAAVSLLIGVLICIGLALNAAFATYRGLARTLADGSENAVQLSIGACLWLGVASLVCAVAALLLTLLPGRTPTDISPSIVAE
jgi:hypothetical protein